MGKLQLSFKNNVLKAFFCTAFFHENRLSAKNKQTNND